jgi:hypothetical protein
MARELVYRALTGRRSLLEIRLELEIKDVKCSIGPLDYPIVRILKAHSLFDSASLLEIGSGPFGIGRFRKVPFVGCDISFPFEPAWPMTPMIASTAQLPLKDGEFDVVLVSDVLEHVPPDICEKR